MKTNWLWDTRLSEAKVKKILKYENNPCFYIYAEKLFSRVNNPQMVFGYVSKEIFVRHWPVIKQRISKNAWAKGSANFWQRIYEKILQQLKAKEAP